MLIVDEFCFGKFVFERKVEHSSPEVLFYSSASQLRVFVSFLWVCVVSIFWLRVVHVTSPAYGSGRNVFLAGSGL